MDYDCQYPKYEFLTYLVQCRRFLLHGSRNPNIVEFEPRTAHDLVEFSARTAVYAASDGIWPIVFAIRVPSPKQVAFINGCSRARQVDGTFGPSHYHFALAAEGLRERPWTDGTIYVLPPTTFTPRPTACENGLTVSVEEWASREAVVPLAKLEVRPDDFPFLDQFWGYDPKLLEERYGFFDADGRRDWTALDHADHDLFPIRPAARSDRT